MVVKHFHGLNKNNIGKITHIINHSHGRCGVGAFYKFYMKNLFGLDTDLFYSLSCTNKYLFTSYIMLLSCTIYI